MLQQQSPSPSFQPYFAPDEPLYDVTPCVHTPLKRHHHQRPGLVFALFAGSSPHAAYLLL
jgi:hypothetical protein